MAYKHHCIWIVHLYICTKKRPTFMCTHLILASYWTFVGGGKETPQSFATVPVPLSCSPPGSLDLLELLFRILLSSWDFAHHCTFPSSAFTPPPLCKAVAESLCWVTMLHSVWASCTAVNPLQWPRHLQPMSTTCSHFGLAVTWPSGLPSYIVAVTIQYWWDMKTFLCAFNQAIT